MANAVSATELLREAGQVFDRNEALSRAAAAAWRRGFHSGGEWMMTALTTIRGERIPARSIPFHRLGITKYTAAVIPTFAIVVFSLFVNKPWFVLAAVPAFYLVESQMVFLFPLAIDGRQRLLAESWRMTVRAGGTFAAMKVVLPIAAMMVAGGFLGRGFMRSWCVGCLAVVIWYERVRTDNKARTKLLEVGASLPLVVRQEQLRIDGGASVPARILHISDLHLMGAVSRKIVDQVVAAARVSPDVILLGGDLVDRRAALKLLSEIVGQLCEIAPVWAIAGNHDTYIGIEAVRTTIAAGGGHWLGDDSVLLRFPRRTPLWLDGSISRNLSSGRGRLLCAHNPNIFPEAAARNYSLIFAGHLHGCQWVIGERDGRLYPGALIYKWNGLRFRHGESTMLVSRGVSDTVPIRWNCPREIVLCEVF